jgi:hypothetical protein
MHCVSLAQFGIVDANFDAATQLYPVSNAKANVVLATNAKAECTNTALC